MTAVVRWAVEEGNVTVNVAPSEGKITTAKVSPLPLGIDLASSLSSYPRCANNTTAIVSIDSVRY